MLQSDNRRILIIDDNPDIHDDYRKVLTVSKQAKPGAGALDALLGEPTNQTSSHELHLELESAFQGQEGLEKVKQAIKDGRPYSLAFVDLRMPPGWGGIKTIEEIWKVSPELQVVICSAYSDLSFAEICEKFGTTDSLLILKKPFTSVEVRQLAIALTEKWILGRQAKIKQDDLERLVEEKTEQLKISVQRDPLTNVSNRSRFHEFLDYSIKNLKRYQNGFALVLIDIDHFKQINDTMGHPVGDKLLIQMSKLLQGAVREVDLLARLGGDEFGIILTGISNRNDANKMLERIGGLTARPFEIDSHQIECNLSMGVALADESVTPETLIKKADLALYEAKNAGRGTYRFFDLEMHEQFVNAQALEKELVQAIGNGQLDLFFQPICRPLEQKAIVFESLLRWRHPEQGLIMPSRFIPICEQNGYIHSVGSWVLNEACSIAADWPASTRVAVNVSPVQFRKFDLLLADLDEIFRNSNFEPSRLELEVTENILVSNPEEAIRYLGNLKKRGVRIVLDDFGTGYSSLSYLRKFPFDKVKLDRSFVQDDDFEAFLRLVYDLCKSLDMSLTIEGVETQKQLDSVKNLGPDILVQGFYFAKPGPLGEMNVWLNETTQPIFPTPTLPPTPGNASIQS